MVSDEELARAIAGANEARRPDDIVAFATGHALSAEQLDVAAEEALELAEELGEDVSVGRLWARAAALRDGEAVRWKFACGRRTYVLGGERPRSLEAAIACAEFGVDGLELREPVDMLVDWPREVAEKSAWRCAEELLAVLRPVCDEESHRGLGVVLGELRGSAVRRGELAATAGRMLKAAREEAAEAEENASAAGEDARLNARAYAWAATELAATAVVLVADEQPGRGLGELLRLRREALWPVHAARFCCGRWYSRRTAELDELMHGDDRLVAWMFDVLDELLGAAVAGLLR